MKIEHRFLTLHLAGLFLLLGCLAALSKDDGRYANSPNKKWFSEQKNSVGMSCCDESDGHLYYGEYKINEDGSVTADGHTIESYKVLKSANPTGAAVWWYTENGYGRVTYCFSPGPLT